MKEFSLINMSMSVTKSGKYDDDDFRMQASCRYSQRLKKEIMVITLGLGRSSDIDIHYECKGEFLAFCEKHNIEISYE